MWGCICPANPSAYAVLLPVSVGSQLLRAFVPCLLPPQPFVITTLQLGGGRSVMMLLPPSQLSHMQCLCCDATIKKKTPTIICIWNGVENISWSSEVNVVDVRPDLRFEPHFRVVNQWSHLFVWHRRVRFLRQAAVTQHSHEYCCFLLSEHRDL